MFDPVPRTNHGVLLVSAISSCLPVSYSFYHYGLAVGLDFRVDMGQNQSRQNGLESVRLSTLFCAYISGATTFYDSVHAEVGQILTGCTRPNPANFKPD